MLSSPRLQLALSEQRELIDRLKQQLDELEQYAYSAGEAGPPQAVLVQKQKLVIGEGGGMVAHHKSVRV